MHNCIYRVRESGYLIHHHPLICTSRKFMKGDQHCKQVIAFMAATYKVTSVFWVVINWGQNKAWEVIFFWWVFCVWILSWFCCSLPSLVFKSFSVKLTCGDFCCSLYPPVLERQLKNVSSKTHIVVHNYSFNLETSQFT